MRREPIVGVAALYDRRPPHMMDFVGILFLIISDKFHPCLRHQTALNEEGRSLSLLTPHSSRPQMLSRLKVARGLRLLPLARPSKHYSFQLHHFNYDKINKNFNFDHCAKTVKHEVIAMYLMFLFILFYNN